MTVSSIFQIGKAICLEPNVDWFSFWLVSICNYMLSGPKRCITINIQFRFSFSIGHITTHISSPWLWCFLISSDSSLWRWCSTSWCRARPPREERAARSSSGPRSSISPSSGRSHRRIYRCCSQIRSGRLSPTCAHLFFLTLRVTTQQ